MVKRTQALLPWALALLVLAPGLPAAPAAVLDVHAAAQEAEARDPEGKEFPSRGKRKDASEAPPQGPPGGAARREEPTFEDMTKEARHIEGLFDIYEKDGRYLLALTPEQLDTDFMASITRETGVGQFGLLAAQVLGEVPVRFRKVGRKVQLVLRNTRFTALDDPDIERAVAKSFSESLAGASKIECQPHPKSGAVLVDMAPFFISDVEGIGAAFAQAFQAPYQADRENSYFSGVKGFPDNVEVDAKVHLAGNRPVNFVNLPDPRSLFITYRYSLSRVPAAPGFIPRIADDRVGHFLALFQDFSNDRRETPYVRYVTRWNLEKDEPYAELSRPKEPIVYWLENSVPRKYRKALADGTLLWNRA
ncbi:MAG TPA: DUF5117 domain-containing protein, partial [Candidatus Polarisedimenticolia bacterium]|nr:DUF5117 domain-containing protein [Candidatus Polarisedimenticolia bacterium]